MEELEAVEEKKCLVGAAAAGEDNSYWKEKLLKGHAATGEEKKMLGEHYSNHAFNSSKMKILILHNRRSASTLGNFTFS